MATTVSSNWIRLRSVKNMVNLKVLLKLKIKRD